MVDCTQILFRVFCYGETYGEIIQKVNLKTLKYLIRINKQAMKNLLNPYSDQLFITIKRSLTFFTWHYSVGNSSTSHSADFSALSGSLLFPTKWLFNVGCWMQQISALTENSSTRFIGKNFCGSSSIIDVNPFIWGFANQVFFKIFIPI